MPNRSNSKEVMRYLLSLGMDEYDLSPEPMPEGWPEHATLAADRGLVYPDGLAPVIGDVSDHPDPEEPLPRADVLVMTWTVAEHNALADVLTFPNGRRRWHYYRRRFDEHYADQIRNGAPAAKNRRLGSWLPSRVGNLDVISYKSELHLNQDGKPQNVDDQGNRTPATGDTGYATLPVKDMIRQLIDEVRPSYVITTGTAGGVDVDHDLGDVVVTRGAKYRLSDEFREEDFNAIDDPGAQFKSVWSIPQTHFAHAEGQMARFASHIQEPDFAPPTKRYQFDSNPIPARRNIPSIILDDRDMPEYHPILSTDFFEFGTSGNNMFTHGSAVEMGDAVLGHVCSEMDDPPKWVVVRNVSDPQINHEISEDMQRHWAVWYYEEYGYWTSLNSALATWAIIAGLAD